MLNLRRLFLLVVLGSAMLQGMAQGGRRYFTGDNTSLEEFEQIPKSASFKGTRSMEALPAQVSLKAYAPVPGDQGKTGTCVAWSASYAARTISYCIQNGITDPKAIQKVAFSPDFLYYYIKQPGDADCQQGAKVEPALKILTGQGDVLLSDNVGNCITSIKPEHDQKAKGYTIKAYTALTNQFGRIQKDDIIRIKKSLIEKNPVIFSIKCYSSMFNIGPDGIWNKPEVDTVVGNHALCIVGYDTSRNGGSFEVMNSWGTEWGNKGFFWITEKQLTTYGSYALELMDRESYDPKLSSRGLGDPHLKGSIDFQQCDEFGNMLGTMPVSMNPSADQIQNVFSHYSFLSSYPGGKTRFKILFTTNAPAFVYIFSVDNNSVYSRMFPYADNISPVINATDATVILPNSAKGYRLDDNQASSDKIFVLYSKSPIDIEALKTKIQSQPGTPVTQVIRQTLGSRIIPQQKIRFGADQISFDVQAREEELVCLFVDLTHS